MFPLAFWAFSLVLWISSSTSTTQLLEDLHCWMCQSSWTFSCKTSWLSLFCFISFHPADDKIYSFPALMVFFHTLKRRVLFQSNFNFFMSETKNSSSGNLNVPITKGSYVAVLSHNMALWMVWTFNGGFSTDNWISEGVYSERISLILILMREWIVMKQ